jgi:hypothetical protein
MGIGNSIPVTTDLQNTMTGSKASYLRKFVFMTLVVFLVYVVLSFVGFFLWFEFPVEKINGLTYLKGNSLIYYYLIVNFLDITGVIICAHIFYYKHIHTNTPVVDGILLGIYLIVISWLIDLAVYVFIRKTLPTIHEYFLGKNQPEIGIAWLTACLSAIYSGYLHSEKGKFVRRVPLRKTLNALVILLLISSLLTVIGIKFFDIRP